MAPNQNPIATNSSDILKTMAEYTRWANTELFAALRALPEGEATKSRPSLFPSIVKTLNHPLVTDRMWMATLQGTTHDHKALNEVIHEELEPLAAARAEMDEAIVSYAHGLHADRADEPVAFTLLSGAGGEMSRGMIVMHMINHNSYHRGFVVEIFCQIPAPLPLIDLPVYMRGAGGLTAMPTHLKPVDWVPAQ